MAKVKLNPILEQLTGKMGNMVFRLAHTGKLSLIMAPDTPHLRTDGGGEEKE